MSLKTLPLLFINLGGEMIYILDQRLRAQNIPTDKAKKVLHDITTVMFNKRFMDELFKPQEMYSKKAMRTVFDRLAHASIMRLNTASMDKLYDLMTMAFKYQVSLCLRPMDILLVTFNHMDSISQFVEGAPSIKQQVQYVYKLLIQHYASLSPAEFMLIRQTHLHFFQDMHIRVSIFLKDKVQNANGRFILPIGGPVPCGFDVPGTIRVFSDNGNASRTTKFNPVGKYSQSEQEGSFDMRGSRMTKLGTNMYNIARPVEATISGSRTTATTPSANENIRNPMAKAQLDLLSKLIGGEKKPMKTDFRLNFFNTDEEEEHAATVRPMAEHGTNVVSIDASKKKQSAELSRIMGELKVDSSNTEEDDLLDLMDSAQ